MNQKASTKKTNWNKEIKHSFKISGKAVKKFFTYFFSALMTLMLIGLISGTIVGVAFVIYVNNYIDTDMSDFSILVNNQDKTTKLYYMNYTDRKSRIGTPVEIEDQQLFSTENRYTVTYSQIPTYLIEAFKAIEDERFMEHKGVDWKRTLGATYSFFTGTDSYGGSTITQQLIKNITGENEVTIQRKVQEILRALELEKMYEKEEIITMYLNTINLSQHSYGIQTAAKTYFNKDVSELNLVECAALAAIPKSPTKYNPYLHPDNNRDRRKLVLAKMYELGKISKEEYDAAKDAELVLNVNAQTQTQSATTSWYTDAVIEDAIDLLVKNLGVSSTAASQMIYTGGLSIYTVMDPEVQTIMENYFKDTNNKQNFPRINEGVQPEASMIVIDPYTGDILGLVGGRGEKVSSRVLNYATQTTRSPGSSIKPVATYALGLQEGIITYSSVVEDSPFKKLNGKDWPVNYPAGYSRGPTTIHDAVKRSVNTVAVKVLNKIGLEKSYDFVKNKLNMHSVIGELELPTGTVLTDKNLSALGLGGMNYGVTVRELTAAYQIFVNEGEFNDSRTIIKILDSEGNVIVDNTPEPQFVISPQNATIMTKMLQEVVTGGTAARMTLKNKVNAAGKTGTTSDDNDRWFIGYTPYYLGGVWFGYAMPMNLKGFDEGKSPALLIWDNVMTQLHQKIFDSVSNGGQSLKKFTDAEGVVTVRVCANSGLLATKSCKAESGYFTSSTVPRKYCNYHANTETDATTSAPVTTAPPTTTAPPATTDSTTTTKPVETTKPPVVDVDPGGVETTGRPQDTTTAPPQTEPVTTAPPIVPNQ